MAVEEAGRIGDPARASGTGTVSLPPGSSMAEGFLRESPTESFRGPSGIPGDWASEARGTTYIVVPTHNESANLSKLVEGIRSAMVGRRYRILVVDDGSTDGTQDSVRSLASAGDPIDLLERGAKFGIGSAIRDGLGWSLARGDANCIITMDGDLSHDPREIPRLVTGTHGADLVQGSRYTAGARVEGWSWPRRILSLTANALVRLFLRTDMRDHTTYFRAYSPRAAEAACRTEGCDGYEWALGSLSAIRAEGLSVREVPITFRQRSEGSSKLTTRDMFRWMRYLLMVGLRSGGRADTLARLPQFALVGATGIAVNQGVLFLLIGVAGLWPLAALILAIEASVLWNFEWNDRWTFRGRTKRPSRSHRLLSYHAVCAAGIAINVGVFALLAMGLGVNYLVSNLIAALAGFASNAGGSTSWTWAGR